MSRLDNQLRLAGDRPLIWHSNPPANFMDDLRLSRVELLLIVATFLSCLLINISSINANFGLFILLFQCMISLASPFSALLAFSASQVSADPPDFPLTTAQALVIAWGVHFLLRRRKFKLSYAKPLLITISAYYLYAVVITFAKGYVWKPGNDLDLALIVGIIGSTYLAQVKERYRMALLVILLGALPAVFGYWFVRWGVPIEGVMYDTVLRGVRIGFGRSDANNAGINIALSAAGLFALSLSPIRSGLVAWRENPFLGLVSFVTLVLGIPAVAGTMSRGGLVNLFLSLLTATLFLFFLSKKSYGTLKRSYIHSVVIVIIAAIAIGGITVRTDFLERIESVQDYSFDQTGDFFGRRDIMESSLKIILREPLVGETEYNRISLPGYGIEFASHNVFLDVGRGSGIPGILFYCIFFFYAPFEIWRRKGLAYAYPFLIAYESILLTFLSFSLGNHKTFFLLWTLLVLAARSQPFKPHRLVERGQIF
jgi:hypothetical protein